MTGFMGWFLAFILVIAIFNAEKLPDLKQMLEEKFKNSVDAAKEGSKLAKHKIKQVRSDIENKKNAANAVPEAEENTPEEIEESLKFMGSFINKDNETAEKNVSVAAEPETNWQDAYAEEEKLVLKEPTSSGTASVYENTADNAAPVVLDGYNPEKNAENTEEISAENISAGVVADGNAAEENVDFTEAMLDTLEETAESADAMLTDAAAAEKTTGADSLLAAFADNDSVKDSKKDPLEEAFK